MADLYTESVQILQSAVKQIDIPKVPSETEFWMVRTRRGAFYHEYITKGFVAIGWNVIDKKTPYSNQEYICQLIKQEYPDEKNPRGPVNKSLRFMYNIKPGDIIMIMGEGEATFAKAGNYYEVADDSTTCAREKEQNQKLKESLHIKEPLQCPYKKRRYIEVLQTCRLDELNPVLYKGLLLNRHSLSNLTNYAEYILSACYDLYDYHDKLTMTFHVASKAELGSCAVSKFIYYSGQLLCYDKSVFIGTRINLNSPGDIVLFIENGISFFEEHALFFLALFACLLGGDIKTPAGSLSLPSLRNLIVAFYNRKDKKEMQQLAIQERQERIRGLKLDNELKEVNLEQTMKHVSDAVVELQIKPMCRKIFSFDAGIKKEANQKLHREEQE